MRRLLIFVRILLLSIIAVGSINAGATITPQPQYAAWVGGTQWYAAPYPTPDAAAQASMALMDESDTVHTFKFISATTSSWMYGQYNTKTGGYDGDGNGIIGILPAQCPAHSTASGDGTCGCESGYVEENGQCVKNSCAEGKIRTVNFTTAWSRNNNKGADAIEGIVGKVNMPGVSYTSACVSGCTVTMDASSVTRGYVSQTPSAEGLYRLSVDATTVTDGKSCGMDQNIPDQAAYPNPVPAKCPGFVGQVNGVTTCVGTASTPLPPASGDVNVMTRTLGTVGDAGNPAAGVVPTSGEGSGTGGVGRTPSTGNGSAIGGPASAATGGSGGSSSSSGTVTKPADGTEQQNCGAPGQPTCKIDESGTPSGSAEAQGGTLKTAADQARADTSAAVEAAKGLEVGAWSWSFQLPTGCTPLTLQGFAIGTGAFVVDVCQWQSVIHDLMAIIWIGAAVWCCIGMVGRTLRS